MGTKNNPGQFDCYEAAEDDEPMFVLLARDALAPDTIEDWARRRFERLASEHTLKEQYGEHLDRAHVQRALSKIAEALACAQAMREWKPKPEPMPLLRPFPIQRNPWPLMQRIRA